MASSAASPVRRPVLLLRAIQLTPPWTVVAGALLVSVPTWAGGAPLGLVAGAALGGASAPVLALLLIAVVGRCGLGLDAFTGALFALLVGAPLDPVLGGTAAVAVLGGAFVRAHVRRRTRTRRPPPAD